jgi:predicted glutamine amidotransferase
MCLIITGPAAKVRQTLLTTPGLLRDIYGSNKDGIGAMFTTDDGALNVTKALPTDLAAAADFIEKLPESDRHLALHFRMRTHGNIDLENCHPYPIVDGQMHLMHNGIISHVDDSSDKSKSDTWHYIEQVLKPQIEAAPQIARVPAWQQLVADDIGNSNKLVLLGKDGHMIVFNRHSGIEHDGMWFSNTYAWTPNILIPNYKWAGWRSRGWDKDEEDYYPGWGRAQGGTTGSGSTAHTTDFKPVISQDDLWEAVAYGDADKVEKFLTDYPISTLYVLYDKDTFVCSVAPKDLAAQDAHIVKLLEDGNQERIAKYCRKSAAKARKVAEVIAWYGDWVSNVDPKKIHSAPQPDQQVIDGIDTDSRQEATHEVVDGQVVPIRSSNDEDPDEADLATWRSDFQDWLARQGYTKGEKVPALEKAPAKWSAAQSPNQFPTTATNPAQVARVGTRSLNYRGYQIDVSDEVLNGPTNELKDHLEREAQRMHDEALAGQRTMPVEDLAHTYGIAEPPLHEPQHLGVEPATDETANDLYAA